MENLVKLLPVIAVVALVVIIFLLGYVKAPPDVAYIISGIRKRPRVLIGRAGIRIPFLERVDKLIVRQISIDIKSEGYIPTNDFIGVDVDAVAKVRVKTDPEGIQLAMKNFLNMREADFSCAIADSLQGNMREIIGTISLKEICNDRKKFGDEVQSKAQTDMSALGIEIISCNIQRVTDENSLINSLGQDNMSKIQKDAAIAKAEAERDVAIAQAQAAKASNDAKVESEMQIAQKLNDLSIRKAELKVQEDTKKAEADAAYTIQQQEQQRSIETATVNAQIAKAEREAELKNKEVEVKKQSLDAEVRAQADADLYRRQKDAEAQLFERQREADAKRAEADAVKYAREQEAAGIAAVGEAEANVIRAKAVAEAEGIDKKAEAMKKYGDAAIVEMIMNALPEIAKNVAEPLSKVDKITMYGEGNSAKLLGDIINGTTQVTEGLSSGMGLDIKSLIAGAIGGMGAGAAYTFVRKLGGRHENSKRIVFYFSAFSCLVCLPFLLFSYAPMTGKQFLFLVLAGAFACVGQLGITQAYLCAPAKEISVYDYTQVIFAAVLGYFIFGDIPDWLSILGYFLICGAGVAMFFYNNRKSARS